MSERAKCSRFGLDHHPVVDFWRREVGDLSSRNFAHRFSASENLVMRLEIHRKLKGHLGCVNTVNFSADGSILISGSDDRRVNLWNWEDGSIKLSFYSGHTNNVFQAKFMPFSDYRSIVTCGADGEVRHAEIMESGKVDTSLLGAHQGRAHKLAVEPGSPHVFYTCGEDGLVQRFDLRTRDAATELFTCQPVDQGGGGFLEAVQLNAITIDPRNPHLFVVAGMEEYARLYDIRRYKEDGSSNFGQAVDIYCPPHLIGNDLVGITGVAFSDQSELLVSYNDEHIYLFTPDMGLGPNPSESAGMVCDDPKAESIPRVYKGHRNCETVKGVNFIGPRCEYVVSGSDCGRIFVWRKKDEKLIRVMEADKHVVNCIEPHPHIPVLASSGIESDIKIWTPKAAERAALPTTIDQRERKPRGWMHHISSPQELLLQLFSFQNQTRRVEREGGESSNDGRELLERFFSLSGHNNDTASDDGDDTSRNDFFS